MVARVKKREAPVAMTTANIIGRMRENCPVISTMMRTAVMGARAAPANAAPMPTTAKTPTGEADSGETTSPKAAPAIAPMKRVGAKTPPDPPIPIVKAVYRARPSIRASRKAIEKLPAMASSSSG